MKNYSKANAARAYPLMGYMKTTAGTNARDHLNVFLIDSIVDEAGDELLGSVGLCQLQR